MTPAHDPYTATAPVCPICGASRTGPYCARCGAALDPRACDSCGAELSPVASYCHRCGKAVSLPRADARGRQDAGDAATSGRTPWLVAGILIILLLAVIIANLMPGKEDQPRRADMANVGNAPPGGAAPEGPAATGAPPDISSLTPQQRFVRLSDRVLRAFASGDSATAMTFAPMAVAAYGMLPDVDAALRYRAASIQARARDYPAALALADSILAASPDHLLGLLVRGDVAQQQGDTTRLNAARQSFNAAYDKEIARQDRPEYQEFRADLNEFRKVEP